ncbi:MAG TPA: 30S ribosomal protein S18 [Planctomycetota bacterium]|nr:30S ribosomal protein S18 [Planctomycetota bacterium]
MKRESGRGERKFRKFIGPPGHRTCTHDAKIDYKDVPLLLRYLTSQGKIQSRKRTKYCAQCQRELAQAIRRARYLALIPYTV